MLMILNILSVILIRYTGYTDGNRFIKNPRYPINRTVIYKSTLQDMERDDADIQTKVYKLQELNRSVGQWSKVEGETGAQLSYQLVSLWAC